MDDGNNGSLAPLSPDQECRGDTLRRKNTFDLSPVWPYTLPYATVSLRGRISHLPYKCYLPMPSGLLNFELHIAPEGLDAYSVRLVDSPRGSLPAQPFELPFAWEDANDFVGQLLLSANRSSRFFQATVKQFGGMLFDALFAGELRVLLGRCRDEAERAGRPLAIRLRLHETPELAGLPWELLYDAGADTFLAQDSRTPLIHSLELGRSAMAPPTARLLRILVVLSDPADLTEMDLPPLDVEAEWENLSTSLQELVDSQTAELVRLEKATLSGLQRALSRTEFHILHFVGHGLFEEADDNAPSGQGVLLFEDDAGNADPVEAERLARLLRNAPSLRLALLNACEGARTALDDPYAGVAQTLLRQGLAGVIAMQFPISDRAGLAFASEFYASLADGHAIDAALTSARLSLYTQQMGSEWATPRLFLQSPDGLLWQLTEPVGTEEQTAEPVAGQQTAFSQPNWQPQTVIQNFYAGGQEQAREDAVQTNRGLTALAGLMQAPEVRNAVVAFQTDLQAAGQQIELLACLKELHDHLHNVEFQCYRMIQQEAARFPTDDLAVENLADNQLTLHDLVEQVQAVLQRPVLHGEETGWNADLVEADRLLQEALAQSQTAPLRRCVQLLKRLLTREPSRINERLNRTAGMLRLEQIESALTGIGAKLTGAQAESGLDRERLAQFGQDVEALGRLRVTVAQAVESHSRWQNLDVELRRVDAVLVHDLDDLIFTWPDVRTICAVLRGDDSESWAAALGQEEERLDKALAAENEALVRRHFYRFRRQAGLRFYAVDTELKELCGELATIAAPLDSVLRLLG